MTAARRPSIVRTPAPRVERVAPSGTSHAYDPLENFDRYAYQSAHTRNGHVPPLPLSLAQAWAEAEATMKEKHP